MARYVTTEEYFDLIRKVMDTSWSDPIASFHPDDLCFAVEYAARAVKVVLESLDSKP